MGQSLVWTKGKVDIDGVNVHRQTARESLDGDSEGGGTDEEVGRVWCRGSRIGGPCQHVLLQVMTKLVGSINVMTVTYLVSTHAA